MTSTPTVATDTVTEASVDTSTNAVAGADTTSLDTTAQPEARTLLIWDSPNMDMGLSSIVGGRPNSYQRPRFDAAGLWLLNKAANYAVTNGLPDELSIAEATLFTNVTPGTNEGLQSFLDALRNIGFNVFAKPKDTSDSDVDEAMLNHIAHRYQEGNLAQLVVASADGRNFKATLDHLATEGVAVIVLGFSEECTWAMEDPLLEFLDIEDIDGIFQQPLPRITLDKLPADGAWLQAYRPLRALLNRATDRTEPAT